MALLALGSQMAFGSIYAVGGEEANVLNTTDCTHTFLEDGVFSLTQEMDVRILLVGGGGGGGRDCAGGGGAGGMLEIDSVRLPAGSYNVIVGQGGAGGVQASAKGGSGTSSIITTADGTVLYEAFGGGGGGAWASGKGLDGASGGGGANNAADGLGIEGQGHAGGAASAHKGNAPSGGGGAGGPGYSATGGKGSVSGDGGPGRISDITGVEVYYAGGGAGGSYSGTPGTGGIGGGGNGIPEISYSNAITKWDQFAGDDGFGGGGGGGNNGFHDGAEGGSGVVIFRLSNLDNDNPNPTVAYSGIEQSNFSATISGMLLSAGATSSDGTGKITLRFSSSLDDFTEDGFTGNKTFVKSSIIDNFDFIVNDLAPNHTYYFQMIAENDSGASAATEVFSFTSQNLDEPLFSSYLGYDEPGLLQYYHPSATSGFKFDENSEGLVLMPGAVMAGVGGSSQSVYGAGYTDSFGTKWDFASHKSYGYIGYMWMEAGSKYNFFEHMGDSCRVSIDDVEVMNDAGIYWDTTSYATYECVETGWHRIMVRLGGSSGGAGNCGGGWSFAFGYNCDGETTCVAKPGGTYSMLMNTEDSTFLYPFKPGRTIDVETYNFSQTDSTKLAFDVSLGDTTGASQVWVLYGDSYQGEATNSWENMEFVGTYDVANTKLSYDVPADAKYVRFFSVQDWGTTSWSPTSLIDLSAVSIMDLGVNHGGDLGYFGVRVNSAGEGDLTVSLVISTNSDMSDATIIPVEDATKVGSFNFSQELNPSTTYYYYYAAETTDGGKDQTSVSSFKTLEATSFSTDISVNVNNRTVSYTGSVSWGAGTTSFVLYAGNTEETMQPVETVVNSINGVTYTVSMLLSDLPQHYYTKLVLVNEGYGGTVWTSESKVFKVETKDIAHYTLKSTVTEGNWDDPLIWNVSNIPADKIITGYPSNSSSNVSLAKNTNARIYVGGQYKFNKMYCGDAINSDIVFYGEDTTVSRLSTDVYGGGMMNGAVSFENMTFSEVDRFDNGVGYDSSAEAKLRFANNAVINYGSGEQRVAGTNSTLVVESGATFNFTSGRIYLIGHGEGLTVSDATINVGHVFVGNVIPQESPSMRIAGAAAKLNVTGGNFKDLNYDKDQAPILSDFTVLFELPKAGYTNGVPVFSGASNKKLFGYTDQDGSTGKFVIKADDKNMRSADSKGFEMHLIGWRSGISVEDLELVSGNYYSLSYTYGWDTENNQPAGLFEPETEGEAPTGVWIQANSASGFMIIVK